MYRLRHCRSWALDQRTPAPRLSNGPAAQGDGADISGGGNMQTMPIVKVRDLVKALEAYIAQKRRAN